MIPLFFTFVHLKLFVLLVNVTFVFLCNFIIMKYNIKNILSDIMNCIPWNDYLTISQQFGSYLSEKIFANSLVYALWKLSPCTYAYVLPKWLSDKEPACQCRISCRRCGFDPHVGKIPWRRKWQPTLVFLPGESYGQRIPWTRSLVGYGPWGPKGVGHNWMTNTFTYAYMWNIYNLHTKMW